MLQYLTKRDERRTNVAGAPTKSRFLGVDVARGVALFSMLAANIYDVLDDDGRPTLAVMTVTGRSATMFVMVAGISLAFITGGRHPVRGRTRQAVSAGLAVRALLIAAIGLALGYADPRDLEVILPYYGLFFLLAIPLVGLRPRTLACIAGALTVVGPLVILGASALGLQPAFDNTPTLGDAFTDPLGLLLQLFVTGVFPAVVYMVYICAGLAIGRLDLSSTKVAARLLGGGLALAVTAWVISSALLFRFGGLQHLRAAAPDETDPTRIRNAIVWDPDRVPSWWWLALRAHHTGTPFDAMHTLGTAMAVLGAVLLLVRLGAARRLLRPIALAGSMTLTIYSVHVLVLGTDFLSDNQTALYLVSVVGSLAFALLWSRVAGQGPLERIVALAAARTRHFAMTALARRSSVGEDSPGRQPASVVASRSRNTPADGSGDIRQPG